MASDTLPGFVTEALSARGLAGAFEARPDYQQAHYVRRVLRARAQATAERRLEQLLADLEAGEYFGRAWAAGPQRGGDEEAPWTKS
jgi:hypothetical protein